MDFDFDCSNDVEATISESEYVLTGCVQDLGLGGLTVGHFLWFPNDIFLGADV